MLNENFKIVWLAQFHNAGWLYIYMLPRGLTVASRSVCKLLGFQILTLWNSNIPSMLIALWATYLWYSLNTENSPQFPTRELLCFHIQCPIYLHWTMS